MMHKQKELMKFPFIYEMRQQQPVKDRSFSEIA